MSLISTFIDSSTAVIYWHEIVLKKKLKNKNDASWHMNLYLITFTNRLKIHKPFYKTRTYETLSIYPI